jgi:ABC-type Fe2+-enterobactin transport system substrate-binding protein
VVRLAAGLLCVVALAAACTAAETPEQQAAARLQKAEAAMNECKARIGLASMPTPTTLVMDDPATRGAEMTPETAAQLRMKVECALPLNELLAAQKQ